MESKAKLLGHPIHPMLISFPLGSRSCGPASEHFVSQCGIEASCKSRVILSRQANLQNLVLRERPRRRAEVL